MWPHTFLCHQSRGHCFCSQPVVSVLLSTLFSLTSVFCSWSSFLSPYSLLTSLLSNTVAVVASAVLVSLVCVDALSVGIGIFDVVVVFIRPVVLVGAFVALVDVFVVDNALYLIWQSADIRPKLSFVSSFLQRASV